MASASPALDCGMPDTPGMARNTDRNYETFHYFPEREKIAVPIRNFSIRGIRKFISFMLKSRMTRLDE
jgi:hypothetical protein